MKRRDLLTEPFLPASTPLPLDRPFTRSEASAQGIRSNDLSWLVGHGFLRRLVKGVYVDTRLPDSTSLRCEALKLVVPEDCVVVDRHAGWALGAGMVLAPNEHIAPLPISVFRPAGMGRLRNSLTDSGERTLSATDVTELHGLRVTTPIRTAWDLGRVRWHDRAIAALDSMLRLGAFEQSELLAGIERFRGMRWVTTLRETAPLADARSQSPGESVLRSRWIDCRLPTVTPQVPVYVGERLIALLDLANEDIRFAAEYDGAEWHSSPEQQARDRTRRADAGRQEWHIVPFVCADVFGARAPVYDMLTRGADDARRRYGRRSA